MDSHAGGKIKDFRAKCNARGKLHHGVVFHVQQPNVRRIRQRFGQHVLREVVLHLHDAYWRSVIASLIDMVHVNPRGLVIDCCIINYRSRELVCSLKCLRCTHVRNGRDVN